jgi:hypothetical protein
MFGVDTHSFGLDQVEIDISKEITDWASLRFDLNHCPSAGTCGAVSQDDDLIEQGFLTLTAPVGNGVTFTFGKFNAPIGFELLDPVDMYQFSHALVFNYGIPTNITGLMLSTTFFDMVDFAFYVVNGWDPSHPDVNKDKSVGGRIGVTPMEGINFGLAGITGWDGFLGTRVSVIDIDGTITIVPDLTIGMEFNFGWDEMIRAIPGDNATWFGFLLMAHYDYTEWGGITIRYDYFDDEDGGTRIPATVGGIAGTPSAPAAPNFFGPADIRQAVAISPTFVIADGFGALVEYRYDYSNKNVFVDKSGFAVNDGSHKVAFEMTYAF